MREFLGVEPKLIERLDKMITNVRVLIKMCCDE